MFAELLGWYTGREQNRRRFPRIKKDFEVEYSLDGKRWQHLGGIDLGGGGLSVLSERVLPVAPFDVRITLGERTIEAKVQTLWDATVKDAANKLTCYGLRFVSVNAEGWAAMIHWITGDDDLSKAEMLQALLMNDKEVTKLLPDEVRARLLDELVSRARFNPTVPLPVQFEYGGIMERDGCVMHRLTLHSAVRSGAQERRFLTRFLVEEGGDEVVVLP